MRAVDGRNAPTFLSPPSRPFLVHPWPDLFCPHCLKVPQRMNETSFSSAGYCKHKSTRADRLDFCRLPHLFHAITARCTWCETGKKMNPQAFPSQKSRKRHLTRVHTGRSTRHDFEWQFGSCAPTTPYRPSNLTSLITPVGYTGWGGGVPETNLPRGGIDAPRGGELFSFPTLPGGRSPPRPTETGHGDDECKKTKAPAQSLYYFLNGTPYEICSNHRLADDIFALITLFYTLGRNS